jgi:micrococcal nuclease
MRLTARVLLVLTLITLVWPLPTTAQERPKGVPRGSEPAVVVSVTDGDTFDVEIDGRRDTVRLTGIDAPETKDPNDPVQCYGPEATKYLRKLLPHGREVWLERDRTDRDRYGRLLRYVWVEKQNGDVYLLNEVLVRDGYAIAKRYPPDIRRAKRIEAAQERAIAAGRGLWSACPDLAAAYLPTPTPVPPPPAPPTPEPQPQPPVSNCDPSYPGICIPPPPPDLDCGDIGYRRFTVLPPDPHGFDRDHDGIGCESG